MNIKDLKKLPPERICEILSEEISNLNNKVQEIKLISIVLKDCLPKAKPEGEPESLTGILEKKACYVLEEIPSVGIAKASSFCIEACKILPYLSTKEEVTLRDLCHIWKMARGHYYGVGSYTEKIVYNYLTKTLGIPESYFS